MSKTYITLIDAAILDDIHTLSNGALVDYFGLNLRKENEFQVVFGCYQCMIRDGRVTKEELDKHREEGTLDKLIKIKNTGDYEPSGYYEQYVKMGIKIGDTDLLRNEPNF